MFLSDALAEIWGVENPRQTEIMVQRPFRAAMRPEFLPELTNVLVEIYQIDKGDRVFKGQIVDAKNGHYVFLGSPLVVKHAELSGFDCHSSDLPLHDRLGDLIIANEANTQRLARGVNLKNNCTKITHCSKKRTECFEDSCRPNLFGLWGSTTSPMLSSESMSGRSSVSYLQICATSQR